MSFQAIVSQAVYPYGGGSLKQRGRVSKLETRDHIHKASVDLRPQQRAGREPWKSGIYGLVSAQTDRISMQRHDSTVSPERSRPKAVFACNREFPVLRSPVRGT